MLQNKTTANGRPLAETLRGILGGCTEGPKRDYGNLAEAWPKIVGAEIASKTRPFFRGTCVVVEATNSTLAFELSQHYGAAILKRLQHEFDETRVQKIWFRVGAV